MQLKTSSCLSTPLAVLSATFPAILSFCSATSSVIPLLTSVTNRRRCSLIPHQPAQNLTAKVKNLQTLSAYWRLATLISLLHTETVKMWAVKNLFLWVHHYELHLPGNTHASFTRRKVHFRCKLLIKSQNLFTTYSKTCLQGTFQTILKTADFVEHDRGSVIPLIHLRAQDRGNTTNQFGWWCITEYWNKGISIILLSASHVLKRRTRQSGKKGNSS